MDILFKNTMKYNKDIYEEFLLFHNKKYRLSHIFYTITIIALILFCLTIQVKYHNYTIAILFCIGLTCFLLWRFFHPICVASKEFKSDKIQNEEEFTFTFFDKYFKIQNRLKYQTIKYRRLYKIFETSTFFYLYIDRTHAFLIDKSTFTIGSSNEFSNFISKKCWFKYKKTC
ncbi:MAG: YcxB family protein [Clostridia bacterium]|nr:YcxB family protein [Clostridia bacterium]